MEQRGREGARELLSARTSARPRWLTSMSTGPMRQHDRPTLKTVPLRPGCHEANPAEDPPGAPRKGDEDDSQPLRFGPRVSIHAPRRRRRPAVAPLRPRQSFNPRPRTGGDHAGGFRSRSRQLVSIDAPRAGGDALRRDHASVVSCFKPRPRAGGDHPGAPNVPPVTKFQATPPRRGRPAVHQDWLSRREFQSTPPRRGRRGDRLPYVRRQRVSIHAPAQGATRGAPGRRTR